MEQWNSKTIRLWNSQDYLTRNTVSSNLLKVKLNKRKKIPKYYNAGTRSSQIWHSRLRMQCSNLNKHMKLRYLTEDQTCQCGYPVEDINHYLTQCPLYSNFRSNYIPRNVTVEDLLYGNHQWNDARNFDLFEKVCNYITMTKRF